MTYIYDNSWEGLLTVIFEIYRSKEQPAGIVGDEAFNGSLFGEQSEVPTESAKAKRVGRKIRSLSSTFHTQLYKVFLSERDEREMLIYRLVRLVLQDSSKINGDYRNPDLLRLKQIVKEVGREVHRMHAFVRFQRTADDIWFAAIEPDFDVVPLIGRHFRQRYADQRWLIYDVKRKYGLHYDLEKMEFVQLDLKKSSFPGELPEDSLHEEEKAYQKLWKEYFSSVNISARKNMKLHVQQLPRRYWKYLFEKD